MKIFYLTQKIVTGYDTYSDCVVIAKNKAEARTIHPANDDYFIKDGKWCVVGIRGDIIENVGWEDWPDPADIDKIKVEYIGEASVKYTKKCVVCSSYHAV